MEKVNLRGAKARGETGTTGALPACMNAISDALRKAGITDFDMLAILSGIGTRGKGYANAHKSDPIDQTVLAYRRRPAERHRVFRRFLGNMMPAGCCVS